MYYKLGIALLCLVLAGCVSVPRSEKPLSFAELEKLYHALLLKGSATGDEPDQGYAFYLRPGVDENGLGLAIIGSVGHGIPRLYFQTSESSWEHAKNFVIINTLSYDLSIRSLREKRKFPQYFKYNPDRFPKKDEVAITVGDPAQRAGRPRLQKIKFLRAEPASRNGKGLHLIFESEVPIKEGFSGAPVMSFDGYLLGVIYGFYTKNPKLCIVSPAEYLFRAIHLFLEN